MLAMSALLMISSTEVRGQQRAAVSAAKGSFTVIGDVDRPGNYGFEPPLTIRNAISTASPVSDAVNVIVLRNGHDRAQSTRLLRLSATDSGEAAMSGDVYVVESLAGSGRQVLPNAVVRSTSGTTVISLEDAGVVIGDVLRGLGIPSDSQTRVSIPCRIHGQRSVESVALSASVQHGDVITVNAGMGAAAVNASDSASGVSGMRPMVSEWAGPRVQGMSGTASEVRLPEIPVAPAHPAPHTERGDLRPGLQGTSAGAEPRLPQLPALAAIPGAAADGRVVIVGEPASEEKVAKLPARGGMPTDEVLMLADSLRLSPDAAVSGSVQDGLSSQSSRAGREISTSGGRPPISAAVATRAEATTDSGKGSEQSQGSDTKSSDTVAGGASASLHWLLIGGLFVAGIWVLGRSLFVGSAAAGQVRSVVSAAPRPEQNSSGVTLTSGTLPPVGPTTVGSSVATPSGSMPASAGSAVSMAAVAAGPAVETSPVRIYSVPRGLRSGDIDTDLGVAPSELDLLISNRLPLDRQEPRLPETLELTGHPRGTSAVSGRMLRVDGAHGMSGRGHGSAGGQQIHRGRSLEDRLSQLIRTVPAGSKSAVSGEATGGASEAVR
jgi:hypothetical protein